MDKRAAKKAAAVMVAIIILSGLVYLALIILSGLVSIALDGRICADFVLMVFLVCLVVYGFFYIFKD